MKINKLSDWKYTFSIKGLDNPFNADWSAVISTGSSKVVEFGVKDNEAVNCVVNGDRITAIVYGGSLNLGQCNIILTSYVIDADFDSGIQTVVGMPQRMTDIDGEVVEIVSELGVSGGNLSNGLCDVSGSVVVDILEIEGGVVERPIDVVVPEVKGTIVYVGGEAVDEFDADSKVDVSDMQDFETEMLNKIDDAKSEAIEEAKNYADVIDRRLTEVDNQLDTLEAQSTAKWVILNETDNRSRRNETAIGGLNETVPKKVDKIDGFGLSETNFTADEKQKLSLLESAKYKGKFTSVALLNAIVGEDGAYAYVDGGVGFDMVEYLWDSSDGKWVVAGGTPTAETPASVKGKYESNPDTNAFTDAQKTKLENLKNFDPTTINNNINALQSGKVDKVVGKNLSSNDYTDLDKAEVAKVAGKAEQSDLNALMQRMPVYYYADNIVYDKTGKRIVMTFTGLRYRRFMLLFDAKIVDVGRDRIMNIENCLHLKYVEGVNLYNFWVTQEKHLIEMSAGVSPLAKPLVYEILPNDKVEIVVVGVSPDITSMTEMNCVLVEY